MIRAEALGLTLRPPWGTGRTHPAPFHLADVSFSVAPGDRVALLGPNGAGKTTLLRLLAGIFQPAEGTLRVDGITTPVIGLRSPFPPDLTAREHLTSWQALSGLACAPKDALGFAGLEAVADRPVRWLSSGQRARLALAPGLVARADTYLVDEGLAVCDPAFRRRALERLRRHARAGAAVVLAGQDLVTARALCERGLVLEDGRLTCDAGLDAAVDAFLAGLDRGREATGETAAGGDAPVLLAEVRVAPAEVEAVARLVVGLRWAGASLGEGCELRVAVKSDAGRPLHRSRTTVAPGTNRVEVGLPTGALARGRYRVALSLVDAAGNPLVTRERAAELMVGESGATGETT